MNYHINAEAVSLDDLQKRIEGTDLVPSRTSLLEGIETIFKTLAAADIATLADLRHELKNAKRLEALASRTEIDKQYLILLRREIEGYFPKPASLKKFDWLPQGEIEKLEREGIANSVAFFNAARTPEDISALSGSTGVDAAKLNELRQLVDLTRIQWVSPLAARMLLDAGYDNAAAVAAADPETLCDALDRLNEKGKYFKGKIGLRDIKRLVHAAGYVVD